MKKCLPFFSLLVMLFSGCGDSYDYDIFGTVSGVITDAADGTPLEHVTVTLIPGANSVVTASDGKYEFSDLTEGQYTVSAQKSGYQSNRKNITVVSDETVSAHITLTKIPVNQQ